jgi:hypothetical protein
VYNRAPTQAEIVADSRVAVVGLIMSKSLDRSNSAALNGSAVSGTIYVYYRHIGPEAASNPARQVTFWLDVRVRPVRADGREASTSAVRSSSQEPSV